MHKTPILLALCGYMSAAPLYATFDFTPPDPQGLAMSGALAAVDGGTFGMMYNPATPSLKNGSSAGAAYSIPYGEAEFATSSGALNWTNLPYDRDGALSSTFTILSPKGYREQTASFGYSRALGTSIHAGMSLSRMSLEIDGRPDREATGVNAGLLVELRPGLMLGISSFNVNAPTVDGGMTTLPRTTLAGFSYRFENGNILTANAQGNPDRPGRILAAGEFILPPSVTVMLGMGTNPSVVSAGASFNSGPVRATAAVSRNIDLGTTAAFGLEMDL